MWFDAFECVHVGNASLCNLFLLLLLLGASNVFHVNVKIGLRLPVLQVWLRAKANIHGLSRGKRVMALRLARVGWSKRSNMIALTCTTLEETWERALHFSEVLALVDQEALGLGLVLPVLIHFLEILIPLDAKAWNGWVVCSCPESVADLRGDLDQELVVVIISKN